MLDCCASLVSAAGTRVNSSFHENMQEVVPLREAGNSSEKGQKWIRVPHGYRIYVAFVLLLARESLFSVGSSRSVACLLAYFVLSTPVTLEAPPVVLIVAIRVLHKKVNANNASIRMWKVRSSARLQWHRYALRCRPFWTQKAVSMRFIVRNIVRNR